VSDILIRTIVGKTYTGLV